MDYLKLIDELSIRPRVWLVTGVAGFIGSNLLESLLKINQTVVGIDNFSTGFKKNLDQVRDIVGLDKWNKFKLLENGDIRSIENCKKAMKGVDYVLHQAALGSVPRSMGDPVATNENNVSGHLNILEAARSEKVKRVIYASSSSVYGDIQDSPKLEERVGVTLSPYALSKKINEEYAAQYWRNFQIEAVGLRYFNVFGKRQNPDGDYAAVIPRWINQAIKNKGIEINGDGETSRDFCYIENVIQANILAALSEKINYQSRILNVAFGEATSLNELYFQIKSHFPEYQEELKYSEFRKGDVRQSLASTERINNILGYKAHYNLKRGLHETIAWYQENIK